VPEISILSKQLKIYPNPFIGYTTIRYSVDMPSEVQLNIYNSGGQLIEMAHFSHNTPGNYKYVWDATKIDKSLVAAGTYFCTIETKNTKGIYKMTDKMILIN